MNERAMVAVVIPCYKVTAHIMKVLHLIGPEVHRIYVIDDACPDNSGDWVEAHCHDPRVTVLRHAENAGVGGAVMTGYQQALKDGATVMVKVDGDGQMDVSLIPQFIVPLLEGRADYTKGNRFFDLRQIHVMPTVRLVGNAILSFFTKLSSGYWDLFDPTNGYTALHASVAQYLPYNKIAKRYFFETDMLFRLNTLRAVVIDIPIDALYGDETSHLNIGSIIPEFLKKHMLNFAKRVFYNYYLRDMSLGSFELPVGIILFLFGLIFGLSHWYHSVSTMIPATPGTVMVAALSLITGIQFTLAFLAQDIASVPRLPFQGLKRNLLKGDAQC